MKIKLLLSTAFFALLILSSISYGQTKNSGEWQLLNSENGIEVYSQIISCETAGFTISPEYLVFKAVNTSTASQTVSLQFEIYFEEGCNGCEGRGETTTEINLAAGESIESSCESFKHRLAYLVFNPNFSGSWHYINSKVLIQPIK